MFTREIHESFVPQNFPDIWYIRTYYDHMIRVLFLTFAPPWLHPGGGGGETNELTENTLVTHCHHHVWGRGNTST